MKQLQIFSFITLFYRVLNPYFAISNKNTILLISGLFYSPSTTKFVISLATCYVEFKKNNQEFYAYKMVKIQLREINSQDNYRLH